MFKVFYFDKKGTAGGSIHTRKFSVEVGADALLDDIRETNCKIFGSGIKSWKKWVPTEAANGFRNAGELIEFFNGNWAMKTVIS